MTSSSESFTAALSLAGAHDAGSASPTPKGSPSLDSSKVSQDDSLEHLDPQKRKLILKFRTITSLLAKVSVGRHSLDQLRVPLKDFESSATSAFRPKDKTVQALTSLAAILVTNFEVVAVAATTTVDGLAVVATKDDPVQQAQQLPPVDSTVSPYVTVQNPTANHVIPEWQESHRCEGCQGIMHEPKINTSEARYIFAVTPDSEVWPMRIDTPFFPTYSDLQRLFCPNRNFVQHVSALSRILDRVASNDTRIRSLLQIYVICSTFQKTARRMNAAASKRMFQDILIYKRDLALVPSLIVIRKTKKFDAAFFTNVVMGISEEVEQGSRIIKDASKIQLKELIALCEAEQPFFKPETFEVIHDIVNAVMVTYRAAVAQCTEQAEISNDNFLKLAIYASLYWRLVYSDTFADYTMTIARIQANSVTTSSEGIMSKKVNSVDIVNDDDDDDIRDGDNNIGDGDSSITGTGVTGKLDELDEWIHKKGDSNFGGLEDQRSDIGVTQDPEDALAVDSISSDIQRKSRELLVCARYQIMHLEAVERLFRTMCTLKTRVKIGIVAVHAPPVQEKENWDTTIRGLHNDTFTLDDATTAINSLRGSASFVRAMEKGFTRVHCEAVIAGLTCHAADSLLLDDMDMFSKASGISLRGIERRAIGVSKLCCPVCTKLLELLRGGLNNLQVRGSHEQLSPCTLPAWLPLDVHEKMVAHFSEILRKVLLQYTEKREDAVPSARRWSHSSNASSTSGIADYSANDRQLIAEAIRRTYKGDSSLDIKEKVESPNDYFKT